MQKKLFKKFKKKEIFEKISRLKKSDKNNQKIILIDIMHSLQNVEDFIPYVAIKNDEIQICMNYHYTNKTTLDAIIEEKHDVVILDNAVIVDNNIFNDCCLYFCEDKEKELREFKGGEKFIKNNSFYNSLKYIFYSVIYTLIFSFFLFYSFFIVNYKTGNFILGYGYVTLIFILLYIAATVLFLILKYKTVLFDFLQLAGLIYVIGFIILNYFFEFQNFLSHSTYNLLYVFIINLIYVYIYETLSDDFSNIKNGKLIFFERDKIVIVQTDEE